MKDFDLIETIQQYLQGSLPDEERLALEKQIAADPRVASVFQACQKAFQAVQAARDEKLRGDMKKWDENE